mgnify:CR=1 FL=1
MSSRLWNVLRRNGFESLEGLREYPKEHFIKFRNMGLATLQELYKIWVKGLTSGHFQYVYSIEIDCDNDTLLAKVKQVGAACHTGNRSCFYRNLVSIQD